MNQDSIGVYVSLVREAVTKQGALDLLPEAAWLRDKTGKQMPSSSTWERVASAIQRDDLVRLTFDEGRLKHIGIECLSFPTANTRALNIGWAALKGRVSEQLDTPGSPKEVASASDRRCSWAYGAVDIVGRASRTGRTWRVRVDLRRNDASRARYGSGTLEDLFVA